MKTIHNSLLLLVCLLFCSWSLTAIGADLPANDAGKYQLILVGPVPDTPAMATLRAATACMTFQPDSPLYKARYESVLGSDAPIVAYLRPDGGIIYFADRYTMPPADKLFSEIGAAHRLAKTAKPPLDDAPRRFMPQPQTPDAPYEDYDSACPDGICPINPLDNPPPRPRFPNLHPFKNPLDSDQPAPFDRMISGWFSDSISSGVWLVFSIIALGFVALFTILLLGAMFVVTRLMTK